jgi:transcriptional regulator with XRE-family HTH domain
MINKSMIVLAREARGITQLELAEKIGVANLKRTRTKS